MIKDIRIVIIETRMGGTRSGECAFTPYDTSLYTFQEKMKVLPEPLKHRPTPG
jgi:hypothetical protein